MKKNISYFYYFYMNSRVYNKSYLHYYSSYSYKMYLSVCKICSYILIVKLCNRNVRLKIQNTVFKF